MSESIPEQTRKKARWERPFLAALAETANVSYDKDGQETGRTYRYSDTLMIFLLKAHRPHKYRDNYHITQDTASQVNVTVKHSEQIQFWGCSGC